MSNKHILLCLSCSWKLVCELEEVGLHELKSDTMSARKFRCPQCGRAIVPRPTSDPQKEQDIKNMTEKMVEDNKKWMQENIRIQEEFAKEIKNDHTDD